MRDGLVPAEFPGSVLVNKQPDDEKNHLKNDYRRWEENIPPEFRYFMERIMPAIAPYRSQHARYKGVKNLSQMCTVSDKAFGLLMLLNKFDNWKAKAESKTEGKKIVYLRKKIVDGQSGNRAGWNIAGLNAYARICKHVEIRRKENKSIEIEETTKLENASNSNQEKRMQFDECDEEEVSDYECEQEREMRGQVNNAWSNPV